MSEISRGIIYIKYEYLKKIFANLTYLTLGLGTALSSSFTIFNNPLEYIPFPSSVKELRLNESSNLPNFPSQS